MSVEMTELVILVDDDDREIGQEEKLRAHRVRRQLYWNLALFAPFCDQGDSRATRHQANEYSGN